MKWRRKLPDWPRCRLNPQRLILRWYSTEAETAKMAGLCAKRLAVATGEDGGPEGPPIQVDDCENIVFEGRTPGNGSGDPRDHTARSEQHQNVDLLQQMTL